MIIRIDFKDNDYQELVENYLKRFNLNVLYDLSMPLYEEKISASCVKVYENAQEKSNCILNPNIDYKVTADDYDFLRERIKASLKEYLLRNPRLNDLVSFHTTEEDRKLQAEEIIPFWKGRSMREKLLAAMTPEWNDCYSVKGEKYDLVCIV